MTAELQQYIWPITVIVIFAGMWVIVMRALSIAHDLAKTVLQQQSARAQAPEPVIPPSVPPAAHPPAVTPSPVKPPVGPDVIIDQGLVDFIKKEEGFTPKAFWDYKQWTNGYGTKAASASEVIDEATATQRLRAEIAAADRHVTSFMPNLPKGQHQALLDLTYNAGPGWEEGSLGTAVKAQKIDTIKSDILQYNHAGGQVLPGLTTRREAEVSWFDHPL
jgi:GH24 family phage-related lysozyme (muramidase)